MVLYSCLVLCGMLVGWLILRYDLYEKEPAHMVLIAIAAGAVGMWAVGYLEEWTLGLLGWVPATGPRLAVVAATHEEALKAAVVLAIAVGFPQEFNDPMDGLVYGSLAGLGAAVYESYHYLAMAHADHLLLPPAEVVRVVGHPVMGGLVGFGVWVLTGRTAAGALAGGLAITGGVALHSLWDCLAFASQTGELSIRATSVCGPMLMLCGFLGYGGCVVVSVRHSRRVFAPDSTRMLWSWPFNRRH